jgi:hypothetical protein
VSTVDSRRRANIDPYFGGLRHQWFTALVEDETPPPAGNGAK